MHSQPTGTAGPRTKREGKTRRPGKVPPSIGARGPGPWRRHPGGWGPGVPATHLRRVCLRRRHRNLQKGAGAQAPGLSPSPSRAPRRDGVEAGEHVARGAPTPHPGKLRPGTGRGSPGSAARASDLRPHVLAARTSGLQTLPQNLPRPSTLRPSPAWPDAGSQVTVPDAGGPISRALIGQWRAADARAEPSGCRRGRRSAPGLHGNGQAPPPGPLGSGVCSSARLPGCAWGGVLAGPSALRVNDELLRPGEGGCPPPEGPPTSHPRPAQHQGRSTTGVPSHPRLLGPCTRAVCDPRGSASRYGWEQPPRRVARP